MCSTAWACSARSVERGTEMEFLDKKYGPFSGRCWGMFVNFFANALAIHGAMKHMLNGGSPVEMYVGIAVTVAVCLVIAVPSKD